MAMDTDIDMGVPEQSAGGNGQIQQSGGRSFTSRSLPLPIGGGTQAPGPADRNLGERSSEMVQAPGSPVLVATERDRIFGEFEELLEKMYNGNDYDAAQRLLTMLEGLSASDQAAICRVVCPSGATFPELMVG
jgi:hypothetical protein